MIGAAEAPPGVAPVLRTLIGMNHRASGASPAYSHQHRVEHELAVNGWSRRPADNPAREQIHDDGQVELASLASVVVPLAVAVLGVTAFAAGLAGYLFTALSVSRRAVAFVAAGLLLAPGPELALGEITVPVLDVAGFLLLAALAWVSLAAGTASTSVARN